MPDTYIPHPRIGSNYRLNKVVVEVVELDASTVHWRVVAGDDIQHNTPRDYFEENAIILRGGAV